MENKHSLTKYRPVLTLEQIQALTNAVVYIEENCPRELIEYMDTYKACKRVFVPLIAKIEVGAINPSHTISQEYKEKLEKAQRDRMYQNGEMTPEEERIYEAEILGM